MYWICSVSDIKEMLSSDIHHASLWIKDEIIKDLIISHSMLLSDLYERVSELNEKIEKLENLLYQDEE